MKNILIITSSYDLTVDYIIDKYSNKAIFYRFNTDLFDMYEIEVNEKGEWKITSPNWVLPESNVFSIYYRKPRFPDLKKYDSRFHKFLCKEMLSTIKGIVESFNGICLSKPSLLERAENKIFQLGVSKEIGFVVPKTNITNSNSAANSFSSKYKSIVKPLSSARINLVDKIGVIQTNVVDEKFEISNLECSPAYFQRYVKKDYEVRVTVVKEEFFSVKIESSNKIDWRKIDSSNKYTLIEIPKDIKIKCIKMMKNLNLKFGAFDFIVSNGKYFFLEINPNGQWYWLEDILKLRISREIIKLLCGEI